MKTVTTCPRRDIDCQADRALQRTNQQDSNCQLGTFVRACPQADKTNRQDRCPDLNMNWCTRARTPS